MTGLVVTASDSHVTPRERQRIKLSVLCVAIKLDEPEALVRLGYITQTITFSPAS